MTASATATQDPSTSAAEEWVEGTVHPTGGYDSVYEDEEEGTVTTEYRRDRVLHREDGPAVTRVGGDGDRDEHFYRHGLLFRVDGPSMATRRPDGSVESEAYTSDTGKLHRQDGPARISYHQSGASLDEWFLDGVRHRLDGPAMVIPPGFGDASSYGFLPSEPLDTEGYHYEWWAHGSNFSYAEYVRLAEALASDAPLEWAIAYARGEQP